MMYALTLFWNGTRVLAGKATAVVARGVSKAHCVDQFGGSRSVRQWAAEAFHCPGAPFGLDKLQAMRTGEIMCGSYKGSTGFAQFTIERIDD